MVDACTDGRQYDNPQLHDETDDLVEGLIKMTTRGARVLGGKVADELKMATARKRSAKTFNEAFGALADREFLDARQSCRARDPIAADVVALERLAAVLLAAAQAPGSRSLQGCPDLEKARASALGYRDLRRAYESRTGIDARSGRKLTDDERAERVTGVHPAVRADAGALHRTGSSKLHEGGLASRASMLAEHQRATAPARSPRQMGGRQRVRG